MGRHYWFSAKEQCKALKDEQLSELSSYLSRSFFVSLFHKPGARVVKDGDRKERATSVAKEYVA